MEAAVEGHGGGYRGGGAAGQPNRYPVPGRGGGGEDGGEMGGRWERWGRAEKGDKEQGETG